MPLNIGLHGKSFSRQVLPFLKFIIQSLDKRNINLYPSKSFVDSIGEKSLGTNQTLDDPKMPDSIDMVFSIGGDGTLLESVTLIRNGAIPILGINTGRLGFLATTSEHMFEETLDQILDDQFDIDERTLIRLDSATGTFHELNFALNEFAVFKKDTSSMIIIHTFLDDEFLNSYWADGLIVSTPTGSTGYSLSCGGPLVLPHTQNFIITPISPHNLNARPIIVSDDSKIDIQVETRSDHFMVSLDSRSQTVQSNIKLSVSKEAFKARLIKTKTYNYLETLRQKLNWGWDIRN